MDPVAIRRGDISCLRPAACNRPAIDGFVETLGLDCYAFSVFDYSQVLRPDPFRSESESAYRKPFTRAACIELAQRIQQRR